MEEPEGVEPSDLENEIEWAIEEQLRKGASSAEVEQSLVDQGWDRDLARREVMRVAEALVDWDELSGAAEHPSDRFKSNIVVGVILALIAPLLWGTTLVRMGASLLVGIVAAVQFFRGLFGFMDWVERRVGR